MNQRQTSEGGAPAVAERIGCGLAAILFVLAVLLPSASFAQDLDPEMEEALANMDADTTVYEKTPVPASSVDKVNLDVHWRLWKRVFSSGKLGIEELEALMNDAVSIGYRNLPDYATAVYSMTASKVASGELEVRDASKLYEMARKLAPDIPYPELAYSAHLARNNLGRMPAIVGSYHRGVRKGFIWLDSRMAWELKIIAFALLAAMVALLSFLLAQLLRYFGIVAYDCARFLPKGFSSNQTVILIVALVVVPGLLMRSPLVSMLILLAILSLVQRINERIVTVLLFGALIALPAIDARMSEQLTWPESASQSLMHAQYLHCDAPCAADVEDKWLEASDDPVLTYTLALTHYRQGSEKQLENVIELLEDQESWPAPMQGAVENLWGATLIAQAKPDEGIEHLEKAKKLDLTSPAAPFNLMRAYQMKNDGSAASAALDEAISVNLDSVRTHLELERRDVNSFLLVEPLAAELFVQRHRERASEQVSLVSPVWAALAGPKLPLDRAPLLGIIGVLIALASLPLYLSGRASSPCPKCGLARDPEDAPKTGNHRYCLPCYHTFVSGASLAYEARVHNERVLGRRERFQDVMRRVLSVVVPGTGHSQAGHGLGGFVITLLTAFGVFVLLRPMGIWRPPYELFSENWAAQQSIAWLLVSIGAFFALTAALRGVSPTETTNRTSNKRGIDE
ncbi:hypothetical protein FIV42_29030 [Persicimonas caeni]|uniref:Tetratricopeptide repeat protein n=1 Tax=Persicimonas caeni TaxID=2292766 RepID=A0A4Y6Q264_PERCE|nr:hypothetical protein [Persicimonas caeni]QDG54643.1 hypothetical protein FIV42_29030 [Persicimonas caeni]QED35864.1 hypothetical protein FRD00_29025 [Persicimonas caeni]